MNRTVGRSDPSKPPSKPSEETPDTDLDVPADLPAVADDGAFRAHATVDECVACQPGRGRGAGTPLSIPPKGWWDIARRAFVKTAEQNVVILAAGIAFFAMLALFPALGAIVTIYALVADPAAVAEHFAALSDILPPDVASIIGRQLEELTGRGRQGLGIGLVLGLLFAIWSARRGVDALVRAVTVAYDERETRGLVRLIALTYLLTLGAIALLVTTVGLLVALPTALAWLPLSGLVSLAARVGSWLLLFVAVTFALGVLYRYGPPRRAARVRWLSLGTVVATLLWVLGSAAFSAYVQGFGRFNEVYGTLGAFIVLLLWFFLGAFSIVFGAVLNAEMEHQTARDTTVGAPRPMGERGAFVADTLGETP